MDIDRHDMVPETVANFPLPLVGEHADLVSPLVWEMIDGGISNESLMLLEQRLRENPDARKRYVEAVQLHVGLTQLFGDRQFPDLD